MKTVKSEMKRRHPLWAIQGRDGQMVEVSRETFIKVQQRMIREAFKSRGKSLNC